MKNYETKIEEIKHAFSMYVDDNGENISNYPLSNTAPEWSIASENEEYLREAVQHFGTFLDLIKDDFQKEIIAAIVYCNEIWLDNFCGGYPLPATNEILKSLPYVRKALRDRNLRITVREHQLLPYGEKEECTHLHYYGVDVTVIDHHNDGWINRQVVWDLSVFN